LGVCRKLGRFTPNLELENTQNGLRRGVNHMHKKGTPPHPYVDSLFFGLLKLLTLIQRLYEPDFRLKQHFLLHFLLFGAFFIF
jgi:hypothetical protein